MFKFPILPARVSARTQLVEPHRHQLAPLFTSSREALRYAMELL